jgi:hypothetical protein
MTDAKRHFMNRPAAEQQVFLASTAFDLTVAARALLVDLDGRELVKALTGVNELQHKLTSQIAALGTGSPCYPEDVFWQILHETAAGHALSETLDRALTFAATREFSK